MTDAEARLWLYLRGEQAAGFRFRRQVPLGPYIVDFVSHRARLVVEVDGGQHASASQQDEKRTAWLTSQGYRVIRFWNNEVLSETDAVLARIVYALKEDVRVPND